MTVDGGSFIGRHGLVRYSGRLGRKYPRTGRCEAGACRLIRQQWDALMAALPGHKAALLADLVALDDKRRAAQALVFDHCHVHGWVRGLVCPDCNGILGAADAGRLADDAPWAQMIAVYRANCPECRESGGTGRP